MQGNHSGGTESNSGFNTVPAAVWISLAILLVAVGGHLIASAVSWGDLTTTTDAHGRRIASLETLPVVVAELKVEVVNLRREQKRTNDLLNRLLIQEKTYHGAPQ